MSNDIQFLTGVEARDNFVSSIVDFVSHGVQIKLSLVISRKANGSLSDNTLFLYKRPDGVSTADASDIVKFIVAEYGIKQVAETKNISLVKIAEQIDKIDVDILEGAH